ncbi:hypothetical protein [Salidesulfovibrio onnuriiensis]|uniref:hypothetical protein n=1 Tax=Salidesulfovibrio onnuriiensis TaxID=2583823 RepID=UPI0011CA497C|nr:hypothetical protein [Salidesulfovibrio onnuriiensis]
MKWRDRIPWIALLMLAAAIMIPHGTDRFREFLGGIHLSWEDGRDEHAAKNGHEGPSAPAESANGHESATPGERPEGHVRNALPGLGCEHPGYGMYTYVLYRWDTRNCASKTGCEKLKLLFSYLGNVRPGEDMADRDPARLNSFYVPVVTTEEGHALSLETYDHRLADRILRKFADAVKARDPELAAHLADDESPGPFLVSTLRPINELAGLQGEFPMLYVDLGNEELECIPEYYKAYRQSLEDKYFGSVEQFKSLELALLNAGLHALRACRIVYGNVLALVGN